MAKHNHILKQHYPLTVRTMGLLGVILLIAAFLIFPRFVAEQGFLQQQEIVIELGVRDSSGNKASFTYSFTTMAME